MKLTLESTEEFFRTDDGIPVRLWEGTTESGTPVIALIAAIGCPLERYDAQLESELLSIPGPQIKALDKQGGQEEC